jgi:hypothetical protein
MLHSLRIVRDFAVVTKPFIHRRDAETVELTRRKIFEGNYHVPGFLVGVGVGIDFG